MEHINKALECITATKIHLDYEINDLAIECIDEAEECLREYKAQDNIPMLIKRALAHGVVIYPQAALHETCDDLFITSWPVISSIEEIEI